MYIIKPDSTPPSLPVSLSLSYPSNKKKKIYTNMLYPISAISYPTSRLHLPHLFL